MSSMTELGWSMSAITDRLAQNRFLRSRIGTPFFLANRHFWRFLPRNLLETDPLRRYGAFLQHLARLRTERAQSNWTCFLRNRAEIAYLAKLASAQPDGGMFSVAVLGCSSGAEAFSAAFAMRDSIGRIGLRILASDIEENNIELARIARYAAGGIETAHLTDDEKRALFEPVDGALQVRHRWRAPIEWAVVDAFSPDLAATIGQHDLVLTNKFLCHMPPEMARRCLRNIATVIRPGGCLIVSGVDLDVRAQMAQELGLSPDVDAVESLHNGDETLRAGWPFDYWGLEPLDRKRRDWPYRYGVAFRKGGHDRVPPAEASTGWHEAART